MGIGTHRNHEPNSRSSHCSMKNLLTEDAWAGVLLTKIQAFTRPDRLCDPGCKVAGLGKPTRRPSWKHIKERRTVHVVTLMDTCHLKISELEPQFQKYKDRVVLRGDIAQDDSGSCAALTAKFVCIADDGLKSDGCHCKATRLRKTSSRRSITFTHTSKNE